MHVSLTVTDVNDNVPEWAMEPFPFLAVVSPEAAGGTEVYKLLAVDADEGIHGTVEYFLLEGKFLPSHSLSTMSHHYDFFNLSFIFPSSCKKFIKLHLCV